MRLLCVRRQQVTDVDKFLSFLHRSLLTGVMKRYVNRSRRESCGRASVHSRFKFSTLRKGVQWSHPNYHTACYMKKSRKLHVLLFIFENHLWNTCTLLLMDMWHFSRPWSDSEVCFSRVQLLQVCVPWTQNCHSTLCSVYTEMMRVTLLGTSCLASYVLMPDYHLCLLSISVGVPPSGMQTQAG